MGLGMMDAVVADLKVFGLDFAEGEDRDAIAEKCKAKAKGGKKEIKGSG